jgi:hypothetical protein
VIRRGEDGTIEAHYAIACFTGQWLSGEAVAASDAQAVLWIAPDRLESLQMTAGLLPLIKHAYSLVYV